MDDQLKIHKNNSTKYITGDYLWMLLEYLKFSEKVFLWIICCRL
jgi:hypothetical protein